MRIERKLIACVSLLGCFVLSRAYAGDRFNEGRIRHVLLISIDGMHAVDYLNCARGISDVNGVIRIAPHWPHWDRRASIIWKPLPPSRPIRSLG